MFFELFCSSKRINWQPAQICVRYYRYGFNGKENDNEVKGDGNQIDYGMRVYDPRLGRFLSVDPLGGKFPFYTPYQFAGNKPIWALDLDGQEDIYYSKVMAKEHSGFARVLQVLTKAGIFQELQAQFASGNHQTNVHINVQDLGDNVGGSTVVFNKDRVNPLQDIRDKNHMMDLTDEVWKTYKKGESATVVNLNVNKLDQANFDPQKLVEVALDYTHEMVAHALNDKTGTQAVPTGKEHEAFYNDPNYNGEDSPDYDKIKPNSPAGRYKARIEKAIKDLGFDKIDLSRIKPDSNNDKKEKKTGNATGSKSNGN